MKYEKIFYKKFLKFSLGLIIFCNSFVFAVDEQNYKSPYKYKTLTSRKIGYDFDTLKYSKDKKCYSIDVVYENSVMGNSDEETISISPFDGNNIEYIIYGLKYYPRKITPKLEIEYKGFISGRWIEKSKFNYLLVDLKTYYGNATKQYIEGYEIIEKDFIDSLGNKYQILKKDVAQICEIKKVCSL